MERAVTEYTLETEVLMAILKRTDNKRELFDKLVKARPVEEIFAHLHSKNKPPGFKWSLSKRQALEITRKCRTLFIPVVGHLTQHEIKDHLWSKGH